MLKFDKKKFSICIFALICVAIMITAPILASSANKNAKAEREVFVLSVWQIDSFEGGRGSRASYLQSIGNDYSKNTDCFLTVTTLTAESARINLAAGTVPDLISYGAGTYGIESYLRGKTPFYTWSHGGYCILSTDTNADFSDISTQNTVVNGGTDNLMGATALFSGLSEANFEKPTAAYVKLINGEYKYLLGTQRDIYRLKTRQTAFAVKPLTQFNDLYQNISVTATDLKKAAQAERFINYLLSRGEQLTQIGLMSDNRIYSDEMSVMEMLQYDVKLISPISENMKNEINSAIQNRDENKLKILLK